MRRKRALYYRNRLLAACPWYKNAQLVQETRTLGQKNAHLVQKTRAWCRNRLLSAQKIRAWCRNCLFSAQKTRSLGAKYARVVAEPDYSVRRKRALLVHKTLIYVQKI